MLFYHNKTESGTVIICLDNVVAIVPIDLLNFLSEEGKEELKELGLCTRISFACGICIDVAATSDEISKVILESPENISI